MGNKYKPWQASDRRPKKFRKLTAMGEGFDNFNGGGRSHKERRKVERQTWKNTWDKDL